MSLQPSSVQAFVSELWAQELVPQLTDYITIPALSPAFDPEWEANGHLRRAVDQIRDWVASRPVAGMTVEIRELPGRTPVILAQIPAFGNHDPQDETVLLYGHCDKQPEMSGWREDLGPWKPVREGDRLYGRGGADDGYAAFASLTAIEAVQASGGSHSRCVLLIEASEESGSPDLPAHVSAVQAELGDVDLVICLDSGCASYETLWLTTSLRGMASATLTVDIVSEGLHSGDASGVVPSTFRIARLLLDRIENSATGAVQVRSANVDIPEYRRQEAAAMIAAIGVEATQPFPFVEGAVPVTVDPVEAMLNRTWRPTLSVIGADGLPPSGQAGNVLRPSTSLRLSFRLPPTADSEAALAEVKEILEADPPYGAHISLHTTESAAGWNAPDLAPWLRSALDESANEVFGQPIQLQGEGGSIPFMGMLGEQFPEAQFVIIGVLGPGSNAHGPNEYLHVAYAEKLTRCLAQVLDSHSGKRVGESA